MTNNELAIRLFVAIVYIGAGIIMLTTDVNPIYLGSLAILVVFVTTFVYALFHYTDRKIDSDDR